METQLELPIRDGPSRSADSFDSIFKLSMRAAEKFRVASRVPMGSGEIPKELGGSHLSLPFMPAGVLTRESHKLCLSH
jgi:hypothetical protein